MLCFVLGPLESCHTRFAVNSDLDSPVREEKNEGNKGIECGGTVCGIAARQKGSVLVLLLTRRRF